MRDFKGKNVGDRLQNAAKAKQAMLERVRAMPGPDDPEFIAKMAERQAIEAARLVRAEARARAEQERLAQEAAKRAEEARLAEIRAREAAARQLAEEAEKKKKRDERYMRRKNRKK